MTVSSMLAFLQRGKSAKNRGVQIWIVGAILNTLNLKKIQSPRVMDFTISTGHLIHTVIYMSHLRLELIREISPE